MPKGRGRKDSDSDAGTEEQVTVGTFQTLRDEGEHFVHVKQYQRAIESFTKALEMEPKDKTCLVTRSKCYLALGNSKAALEDSEAALAEEEGGKIKDVRALCTKADALYQKGDFETALVFYHRGNQLRPELQEFRLGIQKSQEAINNSIGTPDSVKLEATGDLSIFYQQEELKENDPHEVFYNASLRHARTYKFLVKEKKIEEKEKEEDPEEMFGCLLSARHKTLPPEHPLLLHSSLKEKMKQKEKQKGYSKPAAPPKREEKKETTKPQDTSSTKTTKELLGELFEDKAFLDKLYDSMTTSSTEPKEFVQEQVSNALKYLNLRANFWRQQKPMYARERDRRRQQQQLQRGGSSRAGEQDPMQFILRRLEEIDEAQANGKYEQSLNKSQKTLNRVKSWGEDRIKNKPALEANLYSCMGNAYLEMGSFKEALECHNKDLAIGQENELDEAESRALDNLGRTKARMGKYDDAIDLWKKKLPKSKSPLESTWLYHEIGRCYLELGQYGEAKDYGNKSFAAADEADDRGWQLHATVLIAQAEVKCGDLQSAVDSFERGLEIAEELDDKSAQAAIKKALEEVNNRIVRGERDEGEQHEQQGEDDGRRSVKSDREETESKDAKDKDNTQQKEQEAQKDEGQKETEQQAN